MGADALSNTSLQWKAFSASPVVIPEEQLFFMRGLVASYEEELQPNGVDGIFHSVLFSRHCGGYRGGSASGKQAGESLIALSLFGQVYIFCKNCRIKGEGFKSLEAASVMSQSVCWGSEEQSVWTW